jgi:hypothetical protein
MAARKLATWWDFYVGFVLTVPLVLPSLFRKGKIRRMQAAVLGALIALSFFLSLTAVLACALIILFAIAQVVILWYVFDDRWSRLAIATCGVVEFVLIFAKWEFPALFCAGCLPHLVFRDRRFAQNLGLELGAHYTTRTSHHANGETPVGA